VDRVLGDLLSELDDNTVVVVMSDHGFGPLEKDVSLNQFFLERGLMSFSPEKVRPRIPVVDLPPGVPGRTAREALLHRLAMAFPPSRWLSDRALRRGDIPLSLRTWEYMDWGRTVAYSHGLFGNVYINLRGREPEGCVEPRDYERTRERVAEELATLTDPESRERIVDHIYRREEIYSGPFLEEAPDLVVVMKNYAYITRGGRELTQTEVVTDPAVNHTGNHRLDGMLVLFGPGIRQGLKLTGANIMDVMPTVLHLLGIPVPGEVDGRVLTEVLERPEHLVNLAKKLVHGEGGPRRMTGSEEQLVRRRLKALGYFD
jgi:predicted AlkP superfamily phosphohydrolase/phosphomutase